MRVVVTGASRGIGLELVRQHARRGDEVLATCRRPAEAAALGRIAAAHPGLVRMAPLDVADPESIAAAAASAARWPGAVDLLWSNAGIYPGSPGTEVAEGMGDGRCNPLRARDLPRLDGRHGPLVTSLPSALRVPRDPALGLSLRIGFC